MFSRLEARREKPLRFLKYFLIANYDMPASLQYMVREDYIYDWMNNPESPIARECSTSEGTLRFIYKLKDAVNKYLSFTRDPGNSPIENHLRNIMAIGGGTFKLHAMLFMSAQNMDAPTYKRFAELAENVIYYIMFMPSHSHTEFVFAKWCVHVKNITNTAQLNTFISTVVLPEITARKASYQSLFMDFSAQKTGLNGRLTRYILARIAKYIECKRRGSTDYYNISEYLDSRNSAIELEYILPKTPSAAFKAEFNAGGANYDACCNKLGNITLLEKSINCSISNNTFFNHKKQAFQRSQIYLTRSIAALERVGTDTAINRANENLLAYDVWNVESINRRQNLLYLLSEQTFKIEPIVR
jgi:hypothetical protein